MLNINTIIAIFQVLGLYIFIMFYLVPYVRVRFKIILYGMVFITLFFPELDYIKLPFGIIFNFRTYAIVLSGIELIEMTVKAVLEKKLKKEKKMSKRLMRLYDSL